ncbi:MAG: hypothetical protein AAFQ58_19075 [Pseudomonadota bacterium]
MNSHPTRQDDEHTLRILDTAAHDGTAAAREKYDMSNSAVQGLMGRTNARRPDRDPWQCEATKPENQDGGMPRKWWANPSKQRKVTQAIIRDTAKACRMPS